MMLRIYSSLGKRPCVQFVTKHELKVGTVVC